VILLEIGGNSTRGRSSCRSLVGRWVSIFYRGGIDGFGTRIATLTSAPDDMTAPDRAVTCGVMRELCAAIALVGCDLPAMLATAKRARAREGNDDGMTERRKARALADNWRPFSGGGAAGAWAIGPGQGVRAGVN